MKSIAELRKSLSFKSGYLQDQLIREWANQLVDLCAGNFECTMEECSEEDNKEHVFDRKGEPMQPVLMRESILKVKQQL